MTKFFHNIIQRIRSRREGRTGTTYSLRFDAVGLTVSWLTMENETGEDAIRWDDIVAAKVFKRDLFSVDCICLAFQKTDGAWFEVNEDCSGWRDLLPELPRLLVGCTPTEQWLKAVTLPPFEPNETEVYRRKAYTTIESGYTLIELLEFILAAFVASFLADRLARHFVGAWHGVVFWAVTIVGTLALGLLLMVGFGYLFEFIGRHKRSRVPPRVWHQPDPVGLGDVVSERMAPDGRAKVIIIRTPQRTYSVYLYRYDDSDLKEGFTNAVGWIGEMGPSITDRREDADRIAGQFLNAGKPKEEASG